MIELIVSILDLDEFKGFSDNIEIAKGKNKLPLTFREGWKQFKRSIAW